LGHEGTVFSKTKPKRSRESHFSTGKKGFVIPTKSFVKIGITKIFCHNNKMFSSINKTFGCCGKIAAASRVRLELPKLLALSKLVTTELSIKFKITSELLKRGFGRCYRRVISKQIVKLALFFAEAVELKNDSKRISVFIFYTEKNDLVAATKFLFVVPNFVAVTKPFFKTFSFGVCIFLLD